MAKKATSKAKKFRHSIATERLDPRPERSKSSVLDMEDRAVEPGTMSARTTKLVEEVRAAFLHFSTDLGSLTQSRSELAPKFMKAFRLYEKETGGTFVSFVRLLDSTVPASRDGYRRHSSYQAAENLRSLERALLEPVEKPRYAPVTPLTALSQVVAKFLPLVSDPNIVWSAFSSKLHWHEAQVKRLQESVKEQRALVRVVGSISPAPVLRTGTHS